MNFQFDARTILELGKELISSDEIALFELIKNSIDAGSDSIELLIEHYLDQEYFEKAKEYVHENDLNLKEITEYIESKMIYQDGLGYEKFLEKLESAKNRRDYLEILNCEFRKLNKITIKDNGHGMSLKDLEEVYLKVGTKYRRNQNESGKVKLGDKGIGRLSTMRLGDMLVVYTTKVDEKYSNKLYVDWNDFDCSSEKLVEDIDITIGHFKRKNNSKNHGTIIEISDLRYNWDYKIVSSLVNGEIARFINPFVLGKANEILVVRHNGDRILIPSISKELLDSAHAVCFAKYSVSENNEVSIRGKIEYRQYQKVQSFELDTTEIGSIARTFDKRIGKKGHVAHFDLPFDIDSLVKLGDFDLEFYWYNRRIIDSIKNLTENRRESREEIMRWSGGPMLYRNEIRVLPFGDHDDDWLSLDFNAFSRTGFKLNRQQVIGRVSINTPHSVLSEQTNREGFVENDSSRAFINILRWIFDVQIRLFINETDKNFQAKKRKEIMKHSMVHELQNDMLEKISRIEEVIDDEYEIELNKLKKIFLKLQNEYSKIDSNLLKIEKQAKDDHDKFVYLAGIGLLTEFIFHELYRVVISTLDAISEEKTKSRYLLMLKDQLTTLEKRISSFDNFASRKRQVKSKFDLCELIRDVLYFHRDEIQRHDIVLNLDIPDEPYIINAVRGMVLQIIENLVVNSFYWLKEKKEFEKNYSPELNVNLDNDEKFLYIGDNGPGVLYSQRENIFQPFVSYKPTGMGKGLGLYISRDLANYHKWTLKMDEDSNNIRDGRLNGFVLQMT